MIDEIKAQEAPQAQDATPTPGDAPADDAAGANPTA